MSKTAPAEANTTEVLLVQTAFIGDLLLSIPLLKAVRERRPETKVTLLCRKGLGHFLVAAGLVDEAIEITKGEDSDPKSWSDALAALKPRKFSLILCPHESFRSARFVWKLRASRKIGYRRVFNFAIFTDRVERPLHLPEALRQLALLTPVDPLWRERLDAYAANTIRGGLKADGSLAGVPTWAEMSVPSLLKIKSSFLAGSSDRLSPKTKEIINRFSLFSGKSIAVLAPGSVWPTKMWRLDGFVEAANELLSRGYRVVVLGSPAEREICAELVSRAPGSVSVAGELKLFESTELLAIAAVAVCNDSGAMHMAAAAGTPTVAIFGPTVLDFGYRPWQTKSVVLQTELPCRPCGKHGSKACPIGTHDCMKRVKASAVIAAAETIQSN